MGINSHKYIYVYQTINKVNGKTYVGLHSTNNLNDGYIGCGIFSQAHARNKNVFHNAVRKYGYASFQRHILSFYDTYKEAMDEEKYIVNENWVKNKSHYNMALGGGGYMFAGLSMEDISKKYRGEKNHRFGKAANNRRCVLQYTLDGEYIQEFASAKIAADNIGSFPSNISNACLGKYAQCKGFIFKYKNPTESDSKRLLDNSSKRCRIYNKDGTWEMSDSVKQKLRGREAWNKGKKTSPETLEKLSKIRTGKKLKPCSEERKIKIGNANRGRVFSNELKAIHSKSKGKYKKPVLQYDLNGNFINEYESLNHAGRSGFDRWAIKKNIDGISRHHKSFVFKFKSI